MSEKHLNIIIGVGTSIIALLLIIIVVSDIDATAPILSFDPPLTEEQLQVALKRQEEMKLWMTLILIPIVIILVSHEVRQYKLENKN